MAKNNATSKNKLIERLSKQKVQELAHYENVGKYPSACHSVQPTK